MCFILRGTIAQMTMPPAPRLELSNVPLHITQRGVNRCAIFIDDDDRHHFRYRRLHYAGWIAVTSLRLKGSFMVLRGMGMDAKRFAQMLLAVTATFASNLLSAASIAKARAFYENKLYEDAKKELIEVAYSDQGSVEDKAGALNLLATINEEQGHKDLAAKYRRELAKAYPSAKETLDARTDIAREQKALHPDATDSKSASPVRRAVESQPVELPNDTKVLVLSEGDVPRRKLEYVAGTERAQILTRMTILDSDCPTTPSKTPYETAEVDMPVLITATLDRDPGVLLVHMKGTAHFKAGADQESQDLEISTRMTTAGRSLESNGDALDNVPSAVFPSIPVGVGARWQNISNTKAGGKHELTSIATYTLTSLSEKAAIISVDMRLSGQFTEDGHTANIEGGGNGHLVWSASRFTSPGTSMTMFMRATEMDPANTEKPSNISCTLMAMSVK